MVYSVLGESWRSGQGLCIPDTLTNYTLLYRVPWLYTVPALYSITQRIIIHHECHVTNHTPSLSHYPPRTPTKQILNTRKDIFKRVPIYSPARIGLFIGGGGGGGFFAREGGGGGAFLLSPFSATELPFKVPELFSL